MSTTTLASLEARVAAVETGKLDTTDADAFYLLVVGALVFFMQSGFALLEAGSVRAKNTKNILLKNILDACIGAVIWWGWGHAIAYDTDENFNGFIGGLGTKYSFFTNGYDNGTDGLLYAGWWFQFGFAAAAATIVSGAMAERTSLIGYLIYSIFITGFIYPVVVHWSWATGPNGWALQLYNDKGGLLDFAGSGIVHMTGGVAALVGAAIVGPRIGRFDEQKKPLAMPAHNTTFQVLGTFILWLGWYGFNPGSTLALNGQGKTMARAAVVTTLGAAGGGLTTLFWDKLLGSKTWDVGILCNGILGGLVSVTAGAAAIFPWAGLILGIVGGLVYKGSSVFVLKVMKVDDPLDAFSVHGACGLWGVIGAALFAHPDLGTRGLFFPGPDCSVPLASGIAFCAADAVWTSFMCALMFIPLKMAGLLRISADMEHAGMDVSKHGGSAYNPGTSSTAA